MRRIIAVVAFGAVLAACGGGGGKTAQPTTTSTTTTRPTTTTELRPVDQVKLDETRDVAFGEKADLGNGVSITLSDPKVGGDDGGPWLDVAIRSENAGKAPTDLGPQVVIVCAGSTDEGGWQADSTFDLNASVPAGAFSEGRVNLLIPGDDRIGGAVKPCPTPAVIRIDEKVDVAVPDDLISALNALLVK